MDILTYLKPGQTLDNLWLLYLIPIVSVILTVVIILLLKKRSDKAIKNYKEKEENNTLK